jgi:flagellar hook-length control protein FliK
MAEPMSGTTDFAARLQQAAAKLESAGESGFPTDKHDIEGGGGSSPPVAALCSALFGKGQGEKTGEKGSKILADMESVLLKLAGGDLGTVTVGPEGLDALGALLTAAGFNAEEVNTLMADLKEKSGKKVFSLEEVMESLSSLKESGSFAEKENQEDVYLESSALPFLTALLGQLELPKDDINRIVEGADRGQKGISLNRVYDALSAVGNQYRQAGLTLSAKDDQGQLSTVLNQLNLPLPDSAGTESVSLEDLLSVFSNYIKSESGSKGGGNIFSQSLAAQSAGIESMKQEGGLVQEVFLQEGGGKDAMVNRFFQALSVEEKNAAAQPAFSYHQVKDQFKNDLMIPGKGKKEKQGLFAKIAPESDAKTDTLAKVVESTLSKHRDTGLAKNESGPHPGSEGKNDGVKGGDILQGGNPASKSDTVENMFSSTRAKSSDRPLPSYVTNQVNKSIVRAVNNGETSLKIQLKPVELGRLTLTIDNTGNSIKVSIITEHQSARDMLTANVGELRTALQASGISLDSFDVNMGSDFKQSMADAGNQAGQFNRRSKKGQTGNQGSAAGEFEDENPGVAGQVPGRVADGAYHFVA